MTKTTKYVLAVLAVTVIALVGGYVGAGFRDSGSAAAASGGGSWMEAVKSRGELRVGVAIAPPMTVRQGDVLGGPNLIPLEHLAKALGVKLTPVSADWDNIVAGLQAGRYDAAANLDSTLARAKAIQFSDPVYEYQGVFVVKADSAQKTAKQIIDSGQPVAVAQGTAPGAAVAEAGAKTLALNDYTNTLQAVQAGRAVAAFADLPTAESQVQTDTSYKIVVPEPSIYEAGAGYGLPNDIDARSLQLINIGIANARMSGELDRAYAKQHYVPIDQLGDLRKK
ncbi:ABC transporter substrate-binding protein [Nonomuraea guangzhouensis]|uniref:Transporter substrate-binding domain-containing protein n=1 Tax=Nonomuraea guangzhouensis TaxID=1291555 RepID=A0ABW4GR68_9ACTN|nr:transporter substrate-binding domain-containing protein [Nonomuraea guangzhouensis]